MYVSIDIETTGLDSLNNQILELAAVVDIDKTIPIDQLPTFKCRFLHDQIVGQPYALALNANILKDLAKVENIEEEFDTDLECYCKKYNGFNYYSPKMALAFLEKSLNNYFPKGKYIAAGKNFAGFDKPFLDNVTSLDFSHRVIDVGNLFLAPQDNEKIPNLQECLKRASIVKEIAHTALEDAQDVISCYRYWHNNSMGFTAINKI